MSSSLRMSRRVPFFRLLSLPSLMSFRIFGAESVVSIANSSIEKANLSITCSLIEKPPWILYGKQCAAVVICDDSGGQKQKCTNPGILLDRVVQFRYSDLKSISHG